MREVVIPCSEITEMVLEAGGEDLLKCYQCGTCTSSCPWGLVGSLGVRNMIRLAMLGLEGFEGEDVWKCVTCNTCVARCPRGVEIVNIIRAVRAQMTEMNVIPPPLRTALSSITANGNPWLGDRAQRAAWAKELEVKHISEPTVSTLYFTCCTPAYDPRTKNVARSMAKVLKAAGINFGILGAEASCCGDPSHRIGNLEQYEGLKRKNSGLVEKYGVREIICSSPHCMNMFQKHYDGMGNVRVRHYTEVLAEALGNGKLELEVDGMMPEEVKVTYHDPCYLGRHNNQYEAPRTVLGALPGVELVEMPRNREDALCCGGGGGGAWMETKPDERFAALRVEEAVQTGAQVLATSCPYCITMLEDAVKLVGKEDQIKIMDLAELVAAAL